MSDAEEGTLRIARIIARLNVGGPTRHVVWLTAGLPAPEFETTLVTGTVPDGEDDMSEFARAHAVVPVIIPAMSREISPRDVITVWQLFRFFLRFRPHVVHTHTAKAGTAGRLAGVLYRWLTPGALVGRPRRVKFVHTFHGHVFHSYYGRLKTRMFVLIEQMLAWLNTDVIVTISEQQRREIQERFKVGTAAQFRVIPLGMDLVAVPERNNAPAGTVVSIIGRIAPIKNHELLLRVAASRLWPEGVTFRVYGDGAGRQALEQKAAELGVSAGVSFEGTRDVSEIYAASDIVVLTSLNEGTPLTLIEAMSCGIPTMSTAVGGVVDVLGAVQERVQSGTAIYEIRERGVTAESNDAAGFAAGLARLVTDAALRERLAARGRVFARTAYSKERLLADIIALYRELRHQLRA